jgi:hypothetical protein
VDKGPHVAVLVVLIPFDVVILSCKVAAAVGVVVIVIVVVVAVVVIVA